MTQDFMPYKQELQLSLQNVSGVTVNERRRQSFSCLVTPEILSADKKPLWEHSRGDGGADEEDETAFAYLQNAELPADGGLPVLPGEVWAH